MNYIYEEFNRLELGGLIGQRDVAFCTCENCNNFINYDKSKFKEACSNCKDSTSLINYIETQRKRFQSLANKHRNITDGYTFSDLQIEYNDIVQYLYDYDKNYSFYTKNALNSTTYKYQEFILLFLSPEIKSTHNPKDLLNPYNTTRSYKPSSRFIKILKEYNLYEILKPHFPKSTKEINVLVKANRFVMIILLYHFNQLYVQKNKENLNVSINMNRQILLDCFTNMLITKENLNPQTIVEIIKKMSEKLDSFILYSNGLKEIANTLQYNLANSRKRYDSPKEITDFITNNDLNVFYQKLYEDLTECIDMYSFYGNQIYSIRKLEKLSVFSKPHRRLLNKILFKYTTLTKNISPMDSMQLFKNIASNKNNAYNQLMLNNMPMIKAFRAKNNTRIFVKSSKFHAKFSKQNYIIDSKGRCILYFPIFLYYIL